MEASDPATIETLAKFAEALSELRGARSLRDLDTAAKKLSGPDGRTLALPTSTVSDALNGKRVPSVDTLVALLRVCGIDEPTQQVWLQARDRIEHRHHRGPAGAERVRDARPRLLGVHAAIQTDPTPSGVNRRPESELPLYVPRDLDADLRTRLTVAEQQGGFVLLVGGSSAGKTRALFEAVRALVPNWWLLHPTDAKACRQAAATPTDRTVIWLDELQTYLDQPGGLPSATIRDLIAAGTVVVATLWPNEYNKRVTSPVDGQPDPHAEDRRLLGLAGIVTVSDTFSTTERRRAETLADTDTRVRVALDTPDAGFTQVMAAGPELVRWWENAPAHHCYGQAVITAALDARRVGAHTPATLAYLEAAAPGYLTPRQQADAPPDWLPDAIAYATTKLRGATSALCPVAAGMGRVAGYIVADYLHQHALRARRTTHLPDSVWQALLDHHRPNDTQRLADNARRRGRNPEAETLYQTLTDNGDTHAAFRLVDLLVVQGRVDELTRRADNGDTHAAHRLAKLLAKQGRVDDAIALLSIVADNGDTDAAHLLAVLLAEHGRVDDAIALLRPLANNGDVSAKDWLTYLQAKQGRVEELTHLHDNGNVYAARRLATLLAEQGRVEELTHFADTGNTWAVRRLAELLLEQGRVEDAIAPLLHLAGNGDISAADLLAEQGRVDELTHLADNGNIYAARRLATLLADQGRVEDAIARLQHLANNGNDWAADRLATLLAEQGQIDELTHLANNDNHYYHYYAGLRLADLLAEQGQVEDAIARLQHLANNDYTPAPNQLANLLVELGRVKDAIARLLHLADNGNHHAALRLIDLLVEQGRVDELTHFVDNGNPHAVLRLADLLAKQGRVEDAIARLQHYASTGHPSAANDLADLLVELGRVEDAIAPLQHLADNGNVDAAFRLANLLTKRGQLDKLEAEVAAGTRGAIEALESARSRHDGTPHPTTGTS